MSPELVWLVVVFGSLTLWALALLLSLWDERGQ